MAVTARKPTLAERPCDTSTWDAGNCPVRDVMNQIAGKWSTHILQALSEKPYRFGQFPASQVDVSQGRSASVGLLAVTAIAVVPFW